MQDTFWWLSAHDSFRVGLGHHRPIDDLEDWQFAWHVDANAPQIDGWVHSFHGDELMPSFQLYELDRLKDWRVACGDVNVYRTMRLWSDEAADVIGPFLVDIDNTGGESGVPDLEDAHAACNRVREFLRRELAVELDRDVKVFFSGRKGFNIEVRPSSVQIGGSIENQIERSKELLDLLRSRVELGTSHIDPVYGGLREICLKHPYIRLSGSLNCWKDGEARCRKRVEITGEQLTSLTTEELVAIASIPSSGDVKSATDSY